MTHHSFTGTYFPFTSIDPALVSTLSCLLDRLILFQPRGQAMKQPGLSPWTDTGFLDMCTFSADPVDEKRLGAEFENWKAWGQMHEQADLDLVKHMGETMEPAGPIVPAMVSQIKGSGADKKPEKDTTFACHLFLLLAHEFDQQSLESDRQLVQVKKQRESLLAFLRTDGNDREDGLPELDAFSHIPEDRGAFMTERRIQAWSHLFRREATVSPVLVTDSPAVHMFFLDSGEKMEKIGRCALPADMGTDDEKPSDLQNQLRDPLRRLFSTLLTSPWTEALKEKTVDEMARVIKNTGIEKMDEAVGVQWFLVPEIGKEGGGSIPLPRDRENPVRNGLLGFVEPHG